MGYLDKAKDFVRTASYSSTPIESAKAINDAFVPEDFIRSVGKKDIYFSKESIVRPVKTKSNNRANRVFLTIGFVILGLLLIMQQFTLILVIGSLIFINHVLTQAPPESVKYELSNYGVLYDNKQYYWPELKHFFSTKLNGMQALVFDTFDALPGRLFLFIDEEELSKLNEILSRHLPKLDAEPETFFDKAYKKIANTFEF